MTSTIAWEGEEAPGLWREYEGGYEDWKTQRERAAALRAQAARAAERPAPAPPKAVAAAAPRSKLSYKEQRELDALPAQIEAMEAEQKGLAALLADGTIYTRDPDRAASSQARYAALDNELLAALERWEALGAKV